jgi:exopolyphosphatase/guanosine-5'-triphosphate,3'-diphosphate pyrophosphatase
VARYHRRATPKASHRRFDRLETAEQDAVRTLASILRIADGFDRSHLGTVADVDCSVAGDVVTIRPRMKTAGDEDVAAAYRKSGLFENVFRRKIVIIPREISTPRSVGD